MNFLHDVATWFNDPSHWRGEPGIPNRLLEHIQYSICAIVAAIIIAVPIAVWLGHRRQFGTLAVNVSNVGRAIPSFAILVLGTQAFGLLELPVIGSFTTFVALVALAVPPLDDQLLCRGRRGARRDPRRGARCRDERGRDPASGRAADGGAAC